MEKEKFLIKRLVLRDGTLPRPEDIVGYYTPVAVLELKRGERYRKSKPIFDDKVNKYLILIFKDFSDPVAEYLFASVERRAFMRVIRERNRMDWMAKMDGGKRKKVRYTGYHDFIPDDQLTAKFEFTYLFS